MMRRRHQPSFQDKYPQAGNPSSHLNQNSCNAHQTQHIPASYFYWRFLLFLLVSIAMVITLKISWQQEPISESTRKPLGQTIIPGDYEMVGKLTVRKRRNHNEFHADKHAGEEQARNGKNLHDEELKKMRSIPGFSSIFDQCLDPQQPDNANSSGHICGYFHPVQFFKEGQPGHAFRDAVLEQEYPNTKLAAWSWQVNNWKHETLNGSPMQLPKNSILRHVQSVFGFATPKAGSRTQWQLFLDHLSPPKKPVQKRRIGEVTVAHVEELYKRQEKDKQQGGKQKRSDVVFAVIRDPVSRFLSSMAQVLSMRHTTRCHGCDQNLEPCLNDTLSSREVLKCVIRSVQDNGYWNEHIVPSAVFLTRPLAGKDVEMTVFPIQHLDNMVAGFGVREAIQLNQRETKSVDPQVQSLANDLKTALTNGIVDDNTISDICSLYAMDVAIMRYLGFPVKYCDDIKAKR